jgi:hypothetical protein
MSTVAEIAAGIATVIQQETGLRAVEFMSADIPPPSAMLRIPNIERGSFRSSAGHGVLELDFELYVYTQTLFEKAGQQALMDYADFSAGDGSVWKALDDNNDLGLGDVDAKVLRCRFIGIEEQSAFGYFCAVFDIAVSSTGA